MQTIHNFDPVGHVFVFRSGSLIRIRLSNIISQEYEEYELDLVEAKELARLLISLSDDQKNDFDDKMD